MDLASEFRPTSLDDVYGQDPIIASLTRDDLPHAMLFYGPSGVGKTTVARIISNTLGSSLTAEVDAASHAGIDSVRDLVKPMHYKTIDGKPRVLILDECHRLSKQAWDVLLKPLEDAPDNCYFILCTTELVKVPKTIKTRCHMYAFQPVGDSDMKELLDSVGDKCSNEVVDVIISESFGSPRQALTYLSMVEGVDDNEALAVMGTAHGDNPEVIDFCRALMSNVSFAQLVGILGKFEGIEAESVRIVVCNYFASVVIKSNGKGNKVNYAMQVLDAFSQPCNPSEKWAPILLSLSDLYDV